jgi:hypothetical protein
VSQWKIPENLWKIPAMQTVVKGVTRYTEIGVSNGIGKIQAKVLEKSKIIFGKVQVYEITYEERCRSEK